MLVMMVFFTATALEVEVQVACSRIAEVFPHNLLPGATSSVRFVKGECSLVKHRLPPPNDKQRGLSPSTHVSVATHSPG